MTPAAETREIVRKTAKAVLEFSTTIAADLYWVVRDGNRKPTTRNATAFFLQSAIGPLPAGGRWPVCRLGLKSCFPSSFAPIKCNGIRVRSSMVVKYWQRVRPSSDEVNTAVLLKTAAFDWSRHHFDRWGIGPTRQDLNHSVHGGSVIRPRSR
jgi:hypothetical protein